MVASILVALLAAQAAAPAAARGDTVPVPMLPWVEVVQGPGQPASLFCTPAGDGLPFAEAVAFGGAPVDATLEIILYSDYPDYGTPVANFPREDIWLEDSAGGLVRCIGGTIADADTDAGGRTRWALPLRTGGAVDRSAGGRLLILVNGDPGWEQPDVPLGLNSADLDGDGRVDLRDVAIFVQDLFGPYDYRSDFVWDGAINLVDAGRMAAALGRQCP